MNPLIFWKNVLTLLKAHKMTQEKLAKLINVPKSTLNRWVKFNRIPNTYVISSMAVILGVTSNYLLGDKEKDIEARRLSELKVRVALRKIEVLTKAILKEIQINNPIRKKPKKSLNVKNHKILKTK